MEFIILKRRIFQQEKLSQILLIDCCYGGAYEEGPGAIKEMATL